MFEFQISSQHGYDRMDQIARFDFSLIYKFQYFCMFLQVRARNLVFIEKTVSLQLIRP